MKIYEFWRIHHAEILYSCISRQTYTLSICLYCISRQIYLCICLYCIYICLNTCLYIVNLYYLCICLYCINICLNTCLYILILFACKSIYLHFFNFQFHSFVYFTSPSPLKPRSRNIMEKGSTRPDLPYDSYMFCRQYFNWKRVLKGRLLIFLNKFFCYTVLNKTDFFIW